jgi:hypothetical protein
MYYDEVKREKRGEGEGEEPEDEEEYCKLDTEWFLQGLFQT